MYICEICKKAMASIHLTDIHNNVKKELHICEECAAKKGIALQNQMNIKSLISNLPKDAVEEEAPKEVLPDITCPECGMTWKEFRSTGRFGCMHDYTAFREPLAPLLQEIHSNEGGHVGKNPATDAVSNRRHLAILECQRKLHDAVEREAYEEAAQLRDELTRMKADVKEQN